MAGPTTRKVIRTLLLGLIVTLTLICYGASAAMYGNTLIKWWIPVLICLVIAAVSGLTMHRLWRRLTYTHTFVVNYLSHIAVSTGLLLFFFYFINLMVEGRQEPIHEKAVICKLYRETHYHSKRVGRRVYTRGAPYYVYRTDILLDDNRKKSLTITKKRYDTLHKGDTLGVLVRDGFFGVSVLDTDSIKYPHAKKKQRRRLRYFGPRPK